MKSVSCNICGKQFAHTSSMFRHLRTAHNVSKHRCNICNMQFNRKDNYLRHQKNQHRNSTPEDDVIPIILNESPTRTIENNQIGGGENEKEAAQCITEEEAINGNLKVYRFPAQDKTKLDPLNFLRSNYDVVRKTLRVALQKRRSINWYLTMQVRFTKEKKDATETV